MTRQLSISASPRPEATPSLQLIFSLLKKLVKGLILWPIFLFIVWNLLARLVRRIYKFPIPHFMADLIDNPWRRRIQPPDQLARRHGLRPGMHVLDIGPGNGTYTMAAARQVGPAGHIFAIDIEQEMIRRVKQKIAGQNVQNVDARVGDVYALSLPTASIDAAYMITVIGEIPDPVRALQEIHRVLKPEGTIACSELLFDPDYPLPCTIIRWAQEAGFEWVERSGKFFAYTLLFKKPTTIDWSKSNG
jgi:SAM-dependent methyltransferase